MTNDSPYLALKLAHEIYHRSPEHLEEAERRHVATIAARQREIERRILATPEAASVLLPDSSIARAIDEIRGRHADDAEFETALDRVGLTRDTLRSALDRDLKVEAVLEQVGGRAEPVSDADVEIFYLQNVLKFQKPETRSLRHILITINETLPGSERPVAQAKIEAIHARLAKAPDRFAEQALKHSECPTAMNGGLLGSVKRGQLYAELDVVAFALAPGELSSIVESPLGLHVLFCEAIDPARQVPLAEAGERIRARLDAGRREAFQKRWIAGLFRRG